MSNNEPDPTPLEALWQTLQTLIAWLHTLFGTSARLAWRLSLLRDEAAGISAWIAAGEALARRLLAIEAAALKLPPSCRPKKANATRANRKRRIVVHEPDQPNDWHVYFHCFPREHAASRRGARTARASRFVSAWPLAERLEALARVFANPAPYARRFAQHLRRARAHLARALAFTSRLPANRSVYAETLSEAGALAEAAWCDSS